MFKYLKKIIAIGCMLAIVTGVTIGCTASASTNATPAVPTATVQKQALKSGVTISGVLVPQSTVTISGKMTANAVTVNAQVGSQVKKGDTLITLDTTQVNAQLAQAKAALKQANDAVNAAKSNAAAAAAAYKSVQGTVDTAKINLDLQQTLFNHAQNQHENHDPTMDDMTFTKIGAALDTAKSQYATASGPALTQAKDAADAAGKNVTTLQASVDVAQANVDLANVSLQNATITSPVDGVITNRNVNPGELVTAGAQLITVMDTGSLKLKGTVSQELLPILSVGQDIKVAVDIYQGKTFDGKITLIAPESVTTGEYFPIEITLQNADGLKAGLSARAQLDVQSQENLTVPAVAVVQENGQNFVYVFANGLAKKTAVTTGLSNGTDTQVLSGLNQGDEVISGNTDILKDNMPVIKK